jgi:hypothetical protein
VLREPVGAHFSNRILETVMADDTQSTKSLNNAADLSSSTTSTRRGCGILQVA